MLEITPNYITFENGTTIDYYSATDLVYDISLGTSPYLTVLGVFVDTDYKKIKQENFYQPPVSPRRALYSQGDVVQCSGEYPKFHKGLVIISHIGGLYVILRGLLSLLLNLVADRMFFIAALKRLNRLRDQYRKTNPKRRRPKLNGYNLISNPIPEREEFKGYQLAGTHEVELPRLSARRNNGYNVNEQNQIERFLKVSKDKSNESKDSDRIFQTTSKSVKIEIVKFNYERDLTKVIMDLKSLREQMDQLLLLREQDDLEHFVQKKEVYQESEFTGSLKN